MTEIAASASPLSLDALRLARPSQRALAAAGYAHLEQLAGVPEAELLQLHGMEPKALRSLREALTERRLAFGGGNEG
jgi:hypothetical protein